MAPRPPAHWRTDSSQQPGPPPQGIPPQHSPGWLRITLKLLVLPFLVLDLLMQKLMRRLSPPPYKVAGSCKMRGHCCHYILFSWPDLMDRWPWLARFWTWWYTDIHGFYERGFDVEAPDGEVAKVMSCRYLRKDGTCGQYRVRPSICRQWPRIDYTTRPHLLKGCGYRVIYRHPVFDPASQTNPTQTSSPEPQPPQDAHPHAPSTSNKDGASTSSKGTPAPTSDQ